MKCKFQIAVIYCIVAFCTVVLIYDNTRDLGIHNSYNKTFMHEIGWPLVYCNKGISYDASDNNPLAPSSRWMFIPDSPIHTIKFLRLSFNCLIVLASVVYLYYITYSFLVMRATLITILFTQFAFSVFLYSHLISSKKETLRILLALLFLTILHSMYKSFKRSASCATNSSACF